MLQCKDILRALFKKGFQLYSVKLWQYSTLSINQSIPKVQNKYSTLLHRLLMPWSQQCYENDQLHSFLSWHFFALFFSYVLSNFYRLIWSIFVNFPWIYNRLYIFICFATQKVWHSFSLLFTQLTQVVKICPWLPYFKVRVWDLTLKIFFDSAVLWFS